MQKGDSFLLNCFKTTMGKTLVAKVLSVDTILVNSQIRKRLVYEVSDLVTVFSGTVIEGIGNLNYMTPVDHHSYDGLLRCYEDKEIGLYKNQYYYRNSAWSQDCDLIVSDIEDYYKKDLLNVFPNPFNNVLSFHFDNKLNANIILYDFTGKKIIELESSEQNTLNTDNLAYGIYFYKIIFNNKIYKTGSVIKQ